MGNAGLASERLPRAAAPPRNFTMSLQTDPRVDAYIKKSATFAQPILRRLRALVHRACPEATETIKWGFPHFEHAGAILCSMAAFKAHGAFGFWHQGMEKILTADGVTGKDAMGSIGRITTEADLPTDATVLRWVSAAARLNESGAPARPKRGPAKAVPTPADLAAALKKNAKAAKTFAAFAPSHRKEYIEWITEAKRDETRRKRLATTLAWLAEGKPRNWKYLNC
jgi:uncharacterized protein YdeI (YjbR/CyaY-like superfamily)